MAQSWDWLAPRSFVRLPAASEKTTGRPCLPAVETLGDRVLLSAAPAEVVINRLPPDPCLVAYVDGIIGQPQSTESIALDEIQIQKQVDKSTPTLMAALDNEFVKMNNLFGDLDGALVTGTASPAYVKLVQGAVSAEFLKIDSLLGIGSVTADATTDTGLLPAVQKLQSDAGGLLTTLSSLAPGAGGTSIKMDLQYLVLDAAFTDLENNLIKLSADSMTKKIMPSLDYLKIKLDGDYLKIKLDEVIITSQMPTDLAVQASLQGALTEADAIVASLTQPTTDGGGGTTTLT